MRTHVVIPDTQVKPGVPTDHLAWIGQYIVDKFTDKDIVVIHVGDHWDMPSLSRWDKHKQLAMEGRRYEDDVEAGNEGFRVLNGPITRVQAQQVAECRRKRKRAETWQPRRKFLRGNHEDRVTRYVEEDAKLHGKVSLDDLEVPEGWEVHDFLSVVELDGVRYSHYFYNPMTGRPYAGSNVELRLTKIGASFTMGHQQGLLTGMRHTIGGVQRGLVAGSCYLHDEDYKGPQGNAHWRGILVCYEVQGGTYDLMEVSLDYLCRRYEGTTLEKFTRGR